MKWFKYLERNFHAYSVMWKTMTFTQNRYSYAVALTFMWSWQKGRCGGCGVECNKGMFFSRSWSKEWMSSMTYLSTVPWPLRHGPRRPKLIFRWLQEDLGGGWGWGGVAVQCPIVSQGWDLKGRAQRTHFQARLTPMDTICPSEASLLPPFGTCAFRLKKLKITLAMLRS